MIKVMVRERVFGKEGSCKEEMKVRDHKSGQIAQVYNGVLTIYSKTAEDTGKPEVEDAVAGYEPGSWLSWEKS